MTNLLIVIFSSFLTLVTIDVVPLYATTTEGASGNNAAAPTSEQPRPGTLIVITFENGTTKVVRSSSTNVIPVTGGYLVVDPSVVPGQPLPAKTISKTVINQFYTAIAIAIGITITEPPIRGPSDCPPGTIFDPVNKQCDPEVSECPEGEIRGRSGYCAILPKECPSGTSIDEDPICEPGFNQDCPLGTKLNADKTGCEPIECGDGEILQGDECVPGFVPCGPEWGNPCPGTEPEPTPEPVAPQQPIEPELEPEPEPDPSEGNQGEEENRNENGDGGDSDGSTEGEGDSSGEEGSEE